MSIEAEAKKTVREYVEAFNRGDLKRLESLLAEDAEIQGVVGRGLFETIEPIWRQLIEGYGAGKTNKRGFGLTPEYGGGLEFDNSRCHPNSAPRESNSRLTLASGP